MADETKTPKKLSARNDPEWGKKRNERRRQQYATDPDYRKRELDKSRETYHAKAGITPVNLMDNWRKARDAMQPRLVTLPDGTKRQHKCFKKGELADILDKPQKLIYKWIKDHRIPDTICSFMSVVDLSDTPSSRQGVINLPVAVYLLEEVEAMMSVLGPHFAKVTYYRADHMQERLNLWDRVTKARYATGISAPKV